MEQRPTTRVYCAGGTGVNLGQRLPEDMETCFIDTSHANRTTALDNGKCHFIGASKGGFKGSGMVRRLNHDVIAPEIPVVLDRFPPGDFNIVLFSAAGGSGSVIGPLTVRELLQNGHPTIAVVVGADDAQKTLSNTIDTLKSLETISLSANQPLVMSYHLNTAGIRRSAVDDYLLWVMETLAILTSQDNAELDTEDLTSWVRYTRVCDVPPQLSMLHVTHDRREARGILEPITIASLYEDPDKSEPFSNPYFSKAGFPREAIMDQADQLHFVVNTVDVEAASKHLEERYTQLNRSLSGYRQRSAMVNTDDNVSDDDLVL